MLINTPGQAPRFLSVHSQIHNLFRIGRHLLKAHHYRTFRTRSLMQLQADQSIAEANKQDVSESILERIDFIKSAIRRIDLERGNLHSCWL